MLIVYSIESNLYSSKQLIFWSFSLVLRFKSVVPNLFDTMNHLENFRYITNHLNFFLLINMNINEDHIFLTSAILSVYFIVSRNKEKMKLFSVLLVWFADHWRSVDHRSRLKNHWFKCIRLIVSHQAISSKSIVKSTVSIKWCIIDKCIYTWSSLGR